MVSDPLTINRAQPLLANSSPEIRKQLPGCGGIFQVIWIEQIDAHGLFYCPIGTNEELGAILLATHNNGFSCHELAKRMIVGDRQRAIDQLEYIRDCGGTIAHAIGLLKEPEPTPCPEPHSPSPPLFIMKFGDNEPAIPKSPV